MMVNKNKVVSTCCFLGHSISSGDQVVQLPVSCLPKAAHPTVNTWIVSTLYWTSFNTKLAALNCCEYHSCGYHISSWQNLWQSLPPGGPLYRRNNVSDGREIKTGEQMKLSLWFQRFDTSSRPSEGINAVRLLQPESAHLLQTRLGVPRCTGFWCGVFLICFTHWCTHVHIRLSAISICGHAIYLASSECPSATWHNIAHKYQLSSCGSWNIYEGNITAGVFSSVYGEHRKVQQVPANFSTGSPLAWTTGALLAAALLLLLDNLWWSKKRVLKFLEMR